MTAAEKVAAIVAALALYSLAAGAFFASRAIRRRKRPVIVDVDEYGRDSGA